MTIGSGVAIAFIWIAVAVTGRRFGLYAVFVAIFALLATWLVVGK